MPVREERAARMGRWPVIELSNCAVVPLSRRTRDGAGDQKPLYCSGFFSTLPERASFMMPINFSLSWRRVPLRGT